MSGGDALRWANFRRGEKSRLLEAVRDCACRLGRPVCSTDLKACFTSQPGRRPHLTKRLGQQLIVAACPNDGVVPFLRRIGTWNSNAYYAPDDKAHWRLSFDRFVAQEKLRELAKITFLDHIAYLLDGPYQALARQALAGWVLEMEGLIKAAPDMPEVAIRYGEMMAEARRLADCEYRIPMSPVVISRLEAGKIFREEVARRRNSDASVSLARFLALLRWPQSGLFKAEPVPVYFMPQVYAFIRSRWPLDDENPFEQKGLYFCGRYGCAP